MRRQKRITRRECGSFWRRAKPNSKNIFGETTLIAAAQKNSAECIKLLLESGANPLISNNDGKTAVKHAKNKEIRKTLERMMPLA